MRIDELHKFSDGTLTDVRTVLDDRLKGIRMQYLPQSIWRKSDKDKAVAMIQAIDKRLKTKRIMRSLSGFLEEGCTRETFGCYKGPYDLSYAAPIFQENEHYALWKVIEFGNSYQAPPKETGKGSTSESSAKKKGRTVAITTKDMQKRRNDVKARTTEATKKTKKNQLKQQYGNFKAGGSETLKQTFNRLQAIVSHLEFMDVEIKQDDLNQKFLTSLAPEWMMKVIEFGNSYQAPPKETDKGSASKSSSKKKGRTVAITTKDMQKRRNDVKARTTLLLALPDEHQWNASIATRWAIFLGNAEHLEVKTKIGWSYMANEEENYGLVADEEVPTEFALMAKSSSSSKNKVYDDSYYSKSRRKNIENLNTKISKLSEKLSDSDSPKVIKTNKTETARKPPVKYAEMYRNTSKSPKVMGLPKFADDTVTDYSRPMPSIDSSKSNTSDLQNTDSPKVIQTNKTKTARKPPVKYAEMYRNTSKSPKVMDFELKDDTNVLLRTPIQHNMYSIDLNNIVPHKNLTCLVAKASVDENHLGKFDAKGDKGYFVGYSMYSKSFRVFNKRTKKVEENLHVDFLENKLIEKGASTNWLFDSDTLTNSMNYVPVVVAGTSSTNILAHMESSNSDAQDACNVDAPKSSGISNHTATSKIPAVEQMESLTVESEFPTISSPVPTVFLDTSPKTSSGSRLISKEVLSKKETPSLDNALTLSNRFEDTIGVEVNLSNTESSIPASPAPTFRIHKDHPKSQIISLVDTPVQTRHKSKEMEEHSFIATIHQKTTPNLLHFYLFSCFLSQEEPKKIFDALKDPS
nr:hypothetical protein [Tanacetum cinerariifolium]